jgi:hypothetical protein
MYDEPTDDPSEQASDPKRRAKEKSDELRLHAEIFAVFEGNRKFDAAIVPGLDPELARTIQRTMAKLAKSKMPDLPILSDTVTDDAVKVLSMWKTDNLTTNDYHIHRRPGEVMIVRWLEGEQVATYYERFQAHFDAGFGDFRDEERQSLEWKKDPQTLAYLDALDKIEVKMADVYLRDQIKSLPVFVLSDYTVDEMSIAHLVDYVMGIPAIEVVGRASAPQDAPTDQDLTWFFKLFSLRGTIDGMEQMCFFTYLQKADDSF